MREPILARYNDAATNVNGVRTRLSLLGCGRRNEKSELGLPGSIVEPARFRRPVVMAVRSRQALLRFAELGEKGEVYELP